jgi:hypothetical protein
LKPISFRLAIKIVAGYSLVESINSMRKLLIIFYCLWTVNCDTLIIFQPMGNWNNFVVFIIIWSQKNVFSIHPYEDNAVRYNHWLVISSFYFIFPAKLDQIPVQSGLIVPLAFSKTRETIQYLFSSHSFSYWFFLIVTLFLFLFHKYLFDQ